VACAWERKQRRDERRKRMTREADIGRFRQKGSFAEGDEEKEGNIVQMENMGKEYAHEKEGKGKPG